MPIFTQEELANLSQDDIVEIARDPYLKEEILRSRSKPGAFEEFVATGIPRIVGGIPPGGELLQRKAFGEPLVQGEGLGRALDVGLTALDLLPLGIGAAKIAKPALKAVGAALPPVPAPLRALATEEGARFTPFGAKRRIPLEDIAAPPEELPEGVERTARELAGGRSRFTAGVRAEPLGTALEQADVVQPPYTPRAGISHLRGPRGEPQPTNVVPAGRELGEAATALPSGRPVGRAGPVNIPPAPDDLVTLEEVLSPPKPPTAPERWFTALDATKNKLYDREDTLLHLQKQTGVPTYNLARLVPGARADGEEIVRRGTDSVLRELGEKGTLDTQRYMVLKRMEELKAREISIVRGTSSHRFPATCRIRLMWSTGQFRSTFVPCWALAHCREQMEMFSSISPNRCPTPGCRRPCGPPPLAAPLPSP